MKEITVVPMGDRAKKIWKPKGIRNEKLSPTLQNLKYFLWLKQKEKTPQLLYDALSDYAFKNSNSTEHFSDGIGIDCKTKNKIEYLTTPSTDQYVKTEPHQFNISINSSNLKSAELIKLETILFKELRPFAIQDPFAREIILEDLTTGTIYSAPRIDKEFITTERIAHNMDGFFAYIFQDWGTIKTVKDYFENFKIKDMIIDPKDRQVIFFQNAGIKVKLDMRYEGQSKMSYNEYSWSLFNTYNHIERKHKIEIIQAETYNMMINLNYELPFMIEKIDSKATSWQVF